MRVSSNGLLFTREFRANTSNDLNERHLKHCDIIRQVCRRGIKGGYELVHSPFILRSSILIFDIHGSIHLGNKGFIEIPTRCILFIYLSALDVSGYAHLQELQMYFANHRCVY